MNSVCSGSARRRLREWRARPPVEPMLRRRPSGRSLWALAGARTRDRSSAPLRSSRSGCAPAVAQSHSHNFRRRRTGRGGRCGRLHSRSGCSRRRFSYATKGIVRTPERGLFTLWRCEPRIAACGTHRGEPCDTRYARDTILQFIAPRSGRRGFRAEPVSRMGAGRRSPQRARSPMRSTAAATRSS